jgi:hypothetical protein
MRTSPFENGFNGFAGINVLKTTPAVKQEKGGGNLEYPRKGEGNQRLGPG